MISVICARRPFNRSLGAGATLIPIQPWQRFTETDEVAVNFLRGIDRQRITGRAIIDLG